jgi:hypothetical protein
MKDSRSADMIRAALSAFEAGRHWLDDLVTSLATDLDVGR